MLSIAFHPDIHSLIVGGTFNGEVIVWQTNDPDNPIFAISKTSEISHQEPIAKVSWIPSKSAGMWDILSLGTDGKIIIWTLEPKTITPTYGTQLMVSHITRISSSDDSKLGATSFAYSMETKSIIVGTECGAILQCNLSNISPFKTKNDSIKTNPVTLLFSPPHTGPVQYISCSSLSKSLFQSCGGDGQLRIYRNSKDPLLILEPSLKPLYSCDWSRTKSTVFAVSAADGFFYIYDLSVSFLNYR